VSIFNLASGARNPMRGVELSNDTGLTLMPGPIAVFDANAYAGDAQIPHTSRGQNRLLSYAVDLDVVVSSEIEQDNSIVSIRIVDGVVEHRVQQERTTTYTVSNNDETKGRTVLVEHTKLGGWDLAAPAAPYETTESLYRFEVEVDGGAGATLEVVERTTTRSTYELSSYRSDWIALYLQRGEMSQRVADAINKAAEMQREVRALEQRLEQLERDRSEIFEDQERVRRNMNSVDRNSEIYARYLRNFTEQEDRLEELRAQRDATERELEQKRNELRRFVSGLELS